MEKHGDKLKQIRQCFHLTQKDFSNRLGIRPNTYNMIENNRNGVTAQPILEYIFCDLNINPNWFFRGAPHNMFSKESHEVEGFTILKRLKIYIESTNSNISQVEKMLGFPNGSLASQIKNDKSIGSDKLEKIIQTFQDLSADWLLRGKGPMILIKNL